MKTKIVGDIVHVELSAEQGQSVQTVASITVRNADTGKRARAWVSVKISPNGKAEFQLNTLGKTSNSDRHRSAVAAWHNDLL